MNDETATPPLRVGTRIGSRLPDSFSQIFNPHPSVHSQNDARDRFAPKAGSKTIVDLDCEPDLEFKWYDAFVVPVLILAVAVIMLFYACINKLDDLHKQLGR